MTVTLDDIIGQVAELRTRCDDLMAQLETLRDGSTVGRPRPYSFEVNGRLVEVSEREHHLMLQLSARDTVSSIDVLALFSDNVRLRDTEIWRMNRRLAIAGAEIQPGRRGRTNVGYRLVDIRAEAA